MAKTLVIVESPNKIKTLSKILGNKYKIMASVGHFMNLPKKKLGIDIENNFLPEYVVEANKQKVVAELKAAAKTAGTIYFASDPDREGEAIAWHLANVLKKDPNSNCRISFNAITKSAVLDAIKHPRPINLALVNAQQSRRIFDRIIGFKLSPILWKKLSRAKGLSAGRVQSVALYLLCEREKEIEIFDTKEYWSIIAELTHNKNNFTSELIKVSNKKVNITNEKDALEIKSICEKNPFIVSKYNKTDKSKKPYLPFITSTLQQTAANQLNFNIKRTMTVAQKLYEGINVGKDGAHGLITYMRTDSTRIDPEFQKETLGFIKSSFGSKYVTKTPFRVKKSKAKSKVQDAHEAIRPTSLDNSPEAVKPFLTNEQYTLYNLIWTRYIASLMSDSVYETTTIDFTVNKNLLFRSNGSVVKFDGFQKVYKLNDKQISLPKITTKTSIDAKKINCKQHFTKPPSRFSESTLVKTLESNGIGRPSTYASIISNILAKTYVVKKGKALCPTDLGYLVNYFLQAYCSDFININFTANFECSLDKIESGKLIWTDVLKDYYGSFDAMLKATDKSVKKVKIESDIACEQCNKNLIFKVGSNGKFLACSGYPKCKQTKNLPQNINILIKGKLNEKGQITITELLKNHVVVEQPIETTGELCPNCNSPFIMKKGRFGPFMACSSYPKCKTTKTVHKDIGINCFVKKCPGKIIKRKTKTGKIFYGCSKYPDCQFATWGKKYKKCSDCGKEIK